MQNFSNFLNLSKNLILPTTTMPDDHKTIETRIDNATNAMKREEKPKISVFARTGYIISD